MKHTIKKITITGLFKYLDYSIELKPTINILHGINGVGKTTILNIMTNILNGNLKLFYQLSFKRIEVQFDADEYLNIYRKQEKKSNIIYFDFKLGEDEFKGRDIRNTNSVVAFKKRLNLSPLFLPAQRLSIEDIEKEYPTERNIYRTFYGTKREQKTFIPTNTTTEINSISTEIKEKSRQLSIMLNKQFSAIDNQLFEAFFSNTFLQNQKIKQSDEQIIQDKINEIKKSKELGLKTYKRFYQESKIMEKVEQQIYNPNPVAGIEIFLDLYLDNIKKKNELVNKFVKPFFDFETIINNHFVGKEIKIDIDKKIDEIFKINTDAGEKIEIEHLSSGEKNLLLIFYHFLFQIEKNTFFMIDEPELSLHIDWQELIIKHFITYMKGNQILVVTHSPDILQGYNNFEIDLNKCRIK